MNQQFNFLPSIDPDILAVINRNATPTQTEPKTWMVAKRNGQEVPWDESRVIRAISLAYYEVKHPGQVNPHRNSPQDRYGLDTTTFLHVISTADKVRLMASMLYDKRQIPTIEEVQNLVELALSLDPSGREVTRSFARYRASKAEERMLKHRTNGLSEYISLAKYCRYNATLRRRETWKEACARVADMHHTFFSNRSLGKIPKTTAPELLPYISSYFQGKDLHQVIAHAFTRVADKLELPSMRSLQFGGDAILKNEARMYNCSFSHADRVRFFREYFYLLLCGTGCGFSVQKQHVGKLPPLPARPVNEEDIPVTHYQVKDTIEGWANALGALFTSYYEGQKIEYNFSSVRGKGSALKTSGGKAPGHLPLKECLGKVEHILRTAAGRSLRPIEVYDICMFTAKAVLSGGIRRSATICLFSADDEEMVNAKTGDWFDQNPQRSASNNSAILVRSEASHADFLKLFAAQQTFGEPGFYFCQDADHGANPCVEIGLHPVINWPLTPEETAKLSKETDTPLSGWQVCNLSTINGSKCETPEAFYTACVNATVIGTLQAAYTNIPYLGASTKLIIEKDALLGVSICGFMDSPQVLFNPDVLKLGAAICRATNEYLAKQISINAAARITCVKPEGTASLVLGAASGIHPHHAHHYFRRVQANRLEPIYQHFLKFNPHMTDASVYNPKRDDVIHFPIIAPKGAILRKDVNAIQFLKLVKLVQENWVLSGTRANNRSPGLYHNVSNTCTVKDSEWGAVAQFIWENRDFFTGISLLSDAGDKTYAQAPREEVTTTEDITRWNSLLYHEVDYTALREETDNTTLKETVACAGGACELIRT